MFSCLSYNSISAILQLLSVYFLAIDNNAMQWSRNDIHIGGAKRGVVNCFYDFDVSRKIIY